MRSTVVTLHRWAVMFSNDQFHEIYESEQEANDAVIDFMENYNSTGFYVREVDIIWGEES